MWGLLYWAALVPFHLFIFKGMTRAIARRAETPHNAIDDHALQRYHGADRAQARTRSPPDALTRARSEGDGEISER